jgi:hypothetical protein
VLPLAELAADEPNAITDGPFGSKLKTEHYTEDGPRVIRLQNIGDAAFVDAQAHISEKHYSTLQKHRVFPGDLVIAALGESPPRSCLVPDWLGPAVVKADCIRFKAGPRVLPKFVNYALNGPDLRRHAKGIIHGVGRPRLNLGEIKALPVPLPPIPDQAAIVAEIEKQFTRLDAGVAALRRVQANLKRYRAAVLKAACEGHLVPTTGAFEHVPLRSLIGAIGQGWSPKCDTARTALPDEWAVITTTAVQSMRYHDAEVKPLPAQLAPRPHLEIRPRDFLMTRKGPRKRAGVSCLVRQTRSRLMVCDTVYRFRCDEARILPPYLEVALNAPSVVEAIDRQKAGINESGVSLTHDKLGEVMIPVPPLADQERTVAEVERRLSVVEELEATVVANLLRVTRLRQATLQRAFAGQLGPHS